MIIGHNLAEDCYYGFWVGLSRDCVDCAFAEKCELCYESVDIRECYNCNYCQDCIICTDCNYSYDCKGCKNCFGCVNLRNKEFYIFNEAYFKEEYFRRINLIKSSTPPPEFTKLKETLPHNYMQGYQTENVVGDHIFHSKNAFYCFDVNEQEDTMYMFNAYIVKNSIDCNYSGQGSELNYMCHSAVKLYNSNFCNICWYGQNLEYCEYVFNSHDCFGCVSRNHAEYEILNQKYSKEEYFKKVAQIKDELKRDGSYGTWWWPSPYEEIKPFCSYMA